MKMERRSGTGAHFQVLLDFARPNRSDGKSNDSHQATVSNHVTCMRSRCLQVSCGPDLGPELLSNDFAEVLQARVRLDKDFDKSVLGSAQHDLLSGVHRLHATSMQRRREGERNRVHVHREERTKLSSSAGPQLHQEAKRLFISSSKLRRNERARLKRGKESSIASVRIL
jgi:hypothetical protein